jgi:hypothetical protein
VTWEEIERAAEEAADLDSVVRRELQRTPPVQVPPLPDMAPDRSSGRRRWSARALAVLCVVGLGAILSADARGNGRVPAFPAVLRSAPTTATAAPSPTPSPRPHVRAIEAKLIFSAPCWVRAVADGRTVLSATLTRGVRDLRARHSLALVLGNAGAVRLRVNGRAVPTGRLGRVAHLSFELRNGRVFGPQ